ncbi:MAG: nicotinate-nucleotide diphosphorylase (carboxylating) [Bacteroidetes bacterium 4572_112]|nr:MAG: nicotinate-nucleotide diphosphorylase (carboxylating) [Bacteroidetes bacterium 4572_112]
MNIKDIIREAIAEDVGPGDYSSLSTIPKDAQNSAKLLIKEDGIIAGIDIAQEVFHQVDSSIVFEKKIEDGTVVKYGDVGFIVSGSAISILTAERLALNFMQRMSGIATATNRYVKAIEGTNTKVLDTRKTTPLLRELEKYSVKVGGGENHRFALYDMIMIKDNHIDFAGGIPQAIDSCNKYLKDNNLNLRIEVEVRDLDELNQVLAKGNIHRIMLDNFTPKQISEALVIIDKRFETEASGGITIETIRAYAETGVDYISVGALTHHIKSQDMSLVAF